MYLRISRGYVLDMEIRLKLRKIGNSLLITIPSQIVDDLKLKAGDDMLLDVKDSTIVVRKRK
ncbi:MAG TPA: AbrB/MazE/SpoVT family DNA-binding domain-containing protein [Candidatus Bathyarchaeia archaeon]|nr:AbrB/MazE/SpoVT family DNA-binding domain-containing protein [Candidatus Bathyarchaeia archaeon]